MRKLFCVGILLMYGAATMPQLVAGQSYYLSEWQPKTFGGFPGYVDIDPPTGAPTVVLSIDFNDTLAIVPELIYGNNAVGWQKRSDDNPTRVRHYRNANLSILRFPGGNWSNDYFWDAPFNRDLPDDIGIMNEGDTEPAQAAITTDDGGWKMTPVEYYALLDSVGAEGIISVNYSYARYGTSEDPVQRAADYAAEWVRHANIEHGMNIRYWEVGNENYGEWQGGYNVPGKGIITGEEYGRDFCVFAEAMRAVDPTIYVGAVAVEQPTNWNNDYRKWNERMFPEIADCADFLSVHVYFGSDRIQSDHARHVVSRVPHELDLIGTYVRNQWQSLTGKEPIPLALTEFNMWHRYGLASDGEYVEEDDPCDPDVNCYYTVGQLNSLVFALSFGKIIENRFALANAWDLKNGWEGGRDHGLLASEDEPGVEMDTPHGPFYTFYYFTRTFGDVMVKSQSSRRDVSVFASRFSSGEAGIVVVNPTEDDHIARIDVGRGVAGERYYLYEVQAEDPNSRKIYINGETGTQEGGGPEDYELVEAYSNIVDEDGMITVDARKWGAYYIVVENGRDALSVDSPGRSMESIALYPNPTTEWATLRATLAQPVDASVRIYDITGRLIRTISSGTESRDHTLRIDAADLPTGFYLVQACFSDGTTATKKLTVVR